MILTEQDYPIQFVWLYKSLISSLFIVIITFGMASFGYINYFLIAFVAYAPIAFVVSWLARNNFHFALEDKFLLLKQGIISKQERNVPYGVIQHLFVKQDLFDRVFGLASLTIENATKSMAEIQVQKEQKAPIENIGFSGNAVVIPGLNREHAELLKIALLDQMKRNPVEERGL
ncbi:PH domain-containing protein [Candidatus Woesebacteria bacterium]|jgi:uncharacterized membrane protein YdbT with pleckstrin-like domain|nr:PH domain-containing protein [Candidatus Woesebacteria bacterium]